MKVKVLPLENFEHRYTISNRGKVYDLQTKKFLRPRLMSRKDNRGERPTVVVAPYTKDGKRTTLRLGNIVAHHFCKNPNGYINVYHKDRNIQNNNAWNLVWLAPDVHHYAVQNKNSKRWKLSGGVAKHFNRQDALKAIESLKKHNKEEKALINYYQTNNDSYLWDIYKMLANKVMTRARNRVKPEDCYDVLMDSWLYFVDCCKRNTVQNYCFKTWLTHFEFKAKDYWKVNVNLVYTDVHIEDITPRYSVVLPNELLEETNY